MSLKYLTCLTVLWCCQNSYSSDKSETQYFSKDNIFCPRLPKPHEIIDPKTGMPYLTESAKWEAFWNLAYQRDQLLTERIIRVLSEKQIRNSILTEEENDFDVLNRYKKACIDCQDQ